MLEFYLGTMRLAILQQLQYRTALVFWLFGTIAEPVVYLVVWSTVATERGGSVGGYTAGGFAAYYIVFTLVRLMNIGFTPYGWEQRIRQGELAGELLRPIHPLHRDVAYFAGGKFVGILFWIPAAVLLWVLFQPELNPTALEIGVFLVAIWGAFLLRMLVLWLLGMISFWTTRVGAVFELYFALELVLAGRLVPIGLLPDWARALTQWLPFQYSFGFPIDALVGQLTPAQLLGGLAAQLAWIVVLIGVIALVWRVAIRQFTAVGA